MNDRCVFPFGEPLVELRQEPQTPRGVFVLGVYASAVHARWVAPDRKVAALAVASEPRIFWEGEEHEARQIVERVQARIGPLADKIGRLTSAGRNCNGPSGRALKELFLTPLGFTREEVWLCDLIPSSRANPGQLAAISERYAPIARQFGLPEAKIPPVPKCKATDTRQAEILQELDASGAKVLVLLGDEPIRWFLHPVGSQQGKLSDFEGYGRLHSVEIRGRRITVLPLVHPRQAAGLGRHSPEWKEKHACWVADGARQVGEEIRSLCGRP